MTANPPNTSPTEDSVLTLARTAGLRAYWHVAPRYTAGSPAMVPMGVAIRVAVQEFEARERQLTGVFGEALRAEAEAGNLAGIAYARRQAKGKMWRLDLLTGQSFVEPRELNWDERSRAQTLRALKEHGARFAQPFRFTAELEALEARAALHRQRID